MVISERPYPNPDTYEPIPLEELDDLEAMPSSPAADNVAKPVYIINPLKGDQNISGIYSIFLKVGCLFSKSRQAAQADRRHDKLANK